LLDRRRIKKGKRRGGPRSASKERKMARRGGKKRKGLDAIVYSKGNQFVRSPKK